MKFVLVPAALLLLAFFGVSGAQTIVCDGHSCAGSGVVSYDVQLRDYVYRVTGGAVPPALDSVFIGTHDPNLSHYSSICMPSGWTWEIIPASRPDYNTPTIHGWASPAADGNCPYLFLFRNISGAPLSSTIPTDFGFDYYGYPHNVDWTVAAFPPVSANWTATVGEGAGPVHGPTCDTLCENGFPRPYYYLAGIKDNFSTVNGPEPSHPSAALLALMQTLSAGADPYFDSPQNDRCFGHTFTGWDVTGCVVGAQLCFKLTAITGAANDNIGIRDEAVNPIWAARLIDLKAALSGNPADTFFTVGDTLTICLDLANMPRIKRGATYYWPTNILATLEDGDMDILLQDDTKIDFAELTIEICGDTCWATGDVDGNGTSLTMSDLTDLIDFVYNRVLPNGPLWQCDLNGDDHVDQLDIDIYTCYFQQGMSCFPEYPVPTDCDPDTTVQASSIVIFGLQHTPIGNADLDSTGGKLIISDIGSTGDDGVKITQTDVPDQDLLELWAGAMDNFDLTGSLPVGAGLEVAYNGVLDGDTEQTVFATLQTKMATSQWQLGVTSASAAYTVEAWRDGWVVFHADSVTAADLGYIMETARGVYPVGYKGASSGKPASVVATGWNFGASPDGVEWTWAAQGVASLTIDQLVVSPADDDVQFPDEMTSISVMARNIPSMTMAGEGQSDIDTATVFGRYFRSDGLGDIAILVDKLLADYKSLAGNNVEDLNEHAGVCDHGEGSWGWDTVKISYMEVEGLDVTGDLPIGAKIREFFRAVIDGMHNQPLMALFQTKKAANEWDLGVSSRSSTYTVVAKRGGTTVFSGSNLPAADLGYILETARGVYPVGYKGASSGKPASVVSTGWNWGASPDGVEWTWAAHGVANLTIDELEVSWTDTGMVHITDVSAMVKDIPEFTVGNAYRNCANMPGDANDDETVNVGDAVALINYIFKGGTPPVCNYEGDANGDCTLNVGDAVAIINYVFKGGDAPTSNPECAWLK